MKPLQLLASNKTANTWRQLIGDILMQRRRFELLAFFAAAFVMVPADGMSDGVKIGTKIPTRPREHAEDPSANF